MGFDLTLVHLTGYPYEYGSTFRNAVAAVLITLLMIADGAREWHRSHFSKKT